MKFVGSKNRISKELAPIIQSYITENTRGYLEPFVGGANMIDKIKCKRKIGSDIHEELIELLIYAQDLNNELPETISEEEFNKVQASFRASDNKYPKWYYGLVGYACTFGARWFTHSGFARATKSDKITLRDMPNEGIRNIERQRVNLQGITFLHESFLELPKDEIKNYVIYCDIPYQGSFNYNNKFFHDEFYKWCVDMSKNNIVLISEYNMPEDRFKCVWSKNVKVGINLNDTKKHTAKVEKLFIVK